jgi:hypothetical protein
MMSHRGGGRQKIRGRARRLDRRYGGYSKRVKRVALRCEKSERDFRSIVSPAAGLPWIKFVHTARRHHRSLALFRGVLHIDIRAVCFCR